MAIKIIKPGIADSIQDIGRFGFQHLGINPNGVSDVVAASIANALVGNERDAAVLELHFPASTIQFTEDTAIALSGADFSATIENIPIPLNTPIIIKKESILKFEKKISGRVCYMSVHGGFDVKLWLQSKSTNTNAKSGGFEGRNLMKNDVLNDLRFTIYDLRLEQDEIVNRKSEIVNVQCLPWHTSTDNFYRKGEVIRLIKGNEYELLTRECQKTLNASLFTISTQSNRMGFRLQGEALHLTEQKQLLSTAVTRGTIQLLPSGQLIILMADHQTTGGYPRIGNVIAGDMPTLAQKNPSDTIQFRFIEPEAAEDIYMKQQNYLEQMEEVCRTRFLK